MHSIKVTISIVLIFAAIVAFSAYTNNILSTAADEVEAHVARIEESIKSEDWQNVDTQLSIIEDSWQKAEKLWAIFIDHFEIDNIDTTLTRLSMFIETKDKSSALAEAGVLRQFIKHIPEKSSLKIKNIF